MTDILLREDVVFAFGEMRTCAGVRYSNPQRTRLR